MFKSIFRFFGWIIKKTLGLAWWFIRGFLTPWGFMIRVLFILAIVGVCVWAF